MEGIISFKDYIIKEYLDNPKVWEGLDTWIRLFPADKKKVVENSIKRGNYTDLWYKPLRYENAIVYKDCAEIDFVAFSFTILKKHIKNDSDIRMCCDLIDELYQEMPERSDKIKRLRIALFNSIGCVLTSLFDLDLYKKVQFEMYTNMSKLVTFLDKEKQDIIAIGYDSVTIENFHSNQLPDKNNKLFKIPPIDTPFKIIAYNKIIRFYNVVLYQDYPPYDNYFTKFFTKTTEDYDNLKIEICEFLAGKRKEIEWAKYKVSAKKVEEYKRLINDRR